MKHKRMIMLTALLMLVSVMLSCVSSTGEAYLQSEPAKPCECEFMSIIVFPQILANRALEKDEVLALFDTVQQPLFFLSDGSMGSLIDPGSYAVHDRDMLAEVTLGLMKVKGVHVVFGEKPAKATAQLVGYLGEVYKNVLYDYHRPKLSRSPKTYIPVWIYTD